MCDREVNFLLTKEIMYMQARSKAKKAPERKPAARRKTKTASTRPAAKKTVKRKTTTAKKK